MEFLDNSLRSFILACIRIYQTVVSPMLPPRCRFYPTCSSYAIEAVRYYGAIEGGWLALKRIGRCHPWGGHGVDFVPLPLKRYRYYYVKAGVKPSILYPSLMSIKLDRHDKNSGY